MFTAIENGGKVALVKLVHQCNEMGITHFDCQILNEHTARFGAFELSPEEHQKMLFTAVSAKRSQNHFLNHPGFLNRQIGATVRPKCHGDGAPVVA